MPKVLALANWSTIDGVNYARTDAPALVRVWDLVLLTLIFAVSGACFGDIGIVLFAPTAGVYLVAATAVRAVVHRRRACAVDRARSILKHGVPVASG